MEKLTTDYFQLSHKEYVRTIMQVYGKKAHELHKSHQNGYVIIADYAASFIAIALLVWAKYDESGSETLYWTLIASTILVLFGYSYYKYTLISKKKEDYGFIGSPVTLTIFEDKLSFNISETDKVIIPKDNITLIRKRKKEYWIFADSKFYVIPLKLLPSREDQRFFQRHYFVHYM